MSRRSSFSGALLLITSLFCASAVAQDSQPSKVDVFAGYAWIDPGDEINARQISDMPRGFGSSITVYFTEHGGFALDGGGHFGDDGNLGTVMIGPAFRFGGANGVTAFAKTLVGLHYLSLDGVDSGPGIGVTAGGGLDLSMGKAVSFRLIEADLVYGHHAFANFNRLDNVGARLRTGLVFKFGSFGPPPAAVTATCSAQPTQVLEGEPVTITTEGNNFNPKRTLTYTWSGQGVSVQGTGPTVTVDTKGLQPGSYPVRVTVSDGRKNTADCTANVVVRQARAPALTCSITPTQVQVGQSATLSCSGTSPDNRPLTYSHRASAGRFAGQGAGGTINTQGAQPGTITVESTVSDDRNQSSSVTTSLVVVAPPPPPPTPPPAPRPLTAVEKRLTLRSVYFPTGQPTPANPSGGLLLSQQRTLTPIANDFSEYLKTKPGARLQLEGFADPRGDEAYNQALTERRVQRVKDFLVQRGVPEASIDTRAVGEQDQLSPEEVQAQMQRNPNLTEGERQRLEKNLRTIVLANNRRVDITLVIPDRPPQASQQEYPFNAEDALSLIGGREKPAPKPATKPRTKRRPVAKKPTT